MSVTRLNEFTAAAGKENDLLQFLLSLVPVITSFAGCLSCDVLKQQDQPGHFIVLEKWVTTDDHRRAVAGISKSDMQSAIALFGAPPKGAYYEDGSLKAATDPS